MELVLLPGLTLLQIFQFGCCQFEPLAILQRYPSAQTLSAVTMASRLSSSTAALATAAAIATTLEFFVAAAPSTQLPYIIIFETTQTLSDWQYYSELTKNQASCSPARTTFVMFDIFIIALSNSKLIVDYSQL